MRLSLGNHKKIGIDTMVFIYLIERHKTKGDIAVWLFHHMVKRKAFPVCSILVITELLQKPIKQGDHALVNEYQRILFTESSIVFVDITPAVATRGALFAAQNNLKTPDALHVASVIEGGATAFVTADKRIKGVKELEIMYI